MINRCGGSAIVLGGNNNNVVFNFIGTDINGTTALGNGQAGVLVNGANNVIGAPNAGNLYQPGSSGLNSSGVLLFNPNSTGNMIQGNRIGTNSAGTVAIPNVLAGVFIDGATAIPLAALSPQRATYIGQCGQGRYYYRQWELCAGQFHRHGCIRDSHLGKRAWGYAYSRLE